MTTRATFWIGAASISLIVWLIIVASVTADSRQKCEVVASDDVCQWELR